MATSSETGFPLRRQFSLATLLLLVTAAAATLGLQAALPSLEELAGISPFILNPFVLSSDAPKGLVVFAATTNLLCILLVPAAVWVGVMRAGPKPLFLVCYLVTSLFFAAMILVFVVLGWPPQILSSLIHASYAAMLVFAAFALAESFVKRLDMRFRLASLAAIWASLSVPLYVLSQISRSLT
jgi:hypothetical protein